MKTISTDGAPKAIGPYSQAVERGGMVFVSGQIPLDPKTGEVVGTAITEQAKRTIENLQGIIEAANLGLSDVVKVTAYLTDLGDFPKFNEVYGSFFTSHKPARAVVQVSALPKGVRLEMDAICVRPVSSKS